MERIGRNYRDFRDGIVRILVEHVGLKGEESYCTWVLDPRDLDLSGTINRRRKYGARLWGPNESILPVFKLSDWLDVDIFN